EKCNFEISQFVPNEKAADFDSYPMPDSETEVERLRSLHFSINHIWQKPFCSPVDEVLKDGGAHVLDVGCGCNGDWIFELAEKYPSSKFTGFDISSYLPTSYPHQNVKFFKHSIVDGIPYPDNTFDFIHLRGVDLYCTVDEFHNKIMKEFLRALKPGGWLEIVETEALNFDEKSGKVTQKLMSIRWIETLGKVRNSVKSQIPQYLEAHDSEKLFSEYYFARKLYPLSKRGGKAGQLLLFSLMAAYKQLRFPVIKFYPEIANEYDSLVDEYQEEVENFDYHVSQIRFFGRKNFD
ncbi:2082_t:CDS:2, partial [Acaulospora colombiana]